jgi:pimeloyl-ACP methyl ester carboxylesterase
MKTSTRRRIIGIVAAVTMTGGLVTAGPGPVAALPAAAPALDWTLCQDFARALCATVDAPLDYGDPSGPTVQLDVVKLPALLPDQKLGTLFVNPGGPGGSAREFAPYAAELLGPTVATRYDIVGIDPRGVGPQSRMICRTSVKPTSFRWFFPITELQSKSVWRDGRWINQACQTNPNAIVTHMSTADTARDMDLVRGLVGDPVLNYYGISYGTYLGAVYAALFPDRVGRFVVDGVLDPENWATGDGTNADLPFTTRIRSARGAYEALTSALTECDRAGRAACPLAGNALDKWRTMVRLARQHKLDYYGSELTYQDLVGITLSGLYDNYDYSFLGYFLADVYGQATGRRSTGALRGVPLQTLRERAREVIRAPYAAPSVRTAAGAAPGVAARTRNAGDPFLGVACADSQNPVGRTAWWDAGRGQDRAFPWFGSLWTWASAPCSGWLPAAQDDAYLGSFDVTPANPILVVGNSFDPATPVQGARRFTTLFHGSRFLLMDGWGHGAIGNTCVTAAFDAYYATGALPDEGTVCDKDRPLFSDGGFGFRPVDRWRPQAP